VDLLEATGQPVTSGVFDVDLPIPYARQLTDIWCDPADIEMWLSYRQARATAGGTRALQSSIWDWETSHNAGFSVDQWDCSPYAVASAASHWMTDTGFDHFTYEDALSGSRVLAWLLANQRYREPSIALIWPACTTCWCAACGRLVTPARTPVGRSCWAFTWPIRTQGRPSGWARIASCRLTAG
jgi:hypothetical protein